MTNDKNLAMIAAHQRGRNAARDDMARDVINILARSWPVDEGDALLAGYYAELRRLNSNREHYTRIERNWLSDI